MSALFRSDMYHIYMISYIRYHICYLIELYGIAFYFIVSFGIFWHLINGFASYCIVLYCIGCFGVRAVSRKTPIYFISLRSETEIKQVNVKR